MKYFNVLGVLWKVGMRMQNIKNITLSQEQSPSLIPDGGDPNQSSDEKPQRPPFGGLPPKPPTGDGNQDDRLQQRPSPQEGSE
ncbi:salivary acidic proline-rich phosphoprotein 1/2-like isoform X2 [Macaca mulatta]